MSNNIIIKSNINETTPERMVENIIKAYVRDGMRVTTNAIHDWYKEIDPYYRDVLLPDSVIGDMKALMAKARDILHGNIVVVIHKEGKRGFAVECFQPWHNAEWSWFVCGDNRISKCFNYYDEAVEFALELKDRMMKNAEISKVFMGGVIVK